MKKLILFFLLSTVSSYAEDPIFPRTIISLSDGTTIFNGGDLLNNALRINCVFGCIGASSQGNPNTQVNRWPVFLSTGSIEWGTTTNPFNVRFETAQDVLGPLTNTELRATPVPVSPRHPNAIRCNISSTATTSTLITGCSAPGAGLSIYVTAINWSSSIISTTTNFMRLQSGTGGSCGGATTILYDGYVPTLFGNHSFPIPTPWKLTANHELCFVHAGIGTRLVNVTGFIAP